MDDTQLLRYSRHIMLPWLGIEGQQRLLESRVLIAGLGGLGSPVALYLAAAGVGHLYIADFDTVDVSNLQRQVIHGTGDIGRSKVDSATAALLSLNPGIEIIPLSDPLDGTNLSNVVVAVDVAVDCSDNFTLRDNLNRACVQSGTPLVSGAAIRGEGQVTVFPNRNAADPCYRCLYPETGAIEETCSETGVLAPLVGMVGSVQATETLKLLAGFGESLCGRLLMVDAVEMRWREIRLRKDPQCAVCGGVTG